MTDPQILTHPVQSAAARLFRVYERHCTDPDEDTLFDFLNALHSVGDKLNAMERPNLDPSQNFVALRALRNLYHHEAELLHEVRPVWTANVPQLSTDLMRLCLVPRSSIERAVERSRQAGERTAIESMFHWYGPAVNIEPAIFNVMVDVYELLRAKGVVPEGESFARFDRQYNFEATMGYSHRVSGELQVLAGNASALFSTLLASPWPSQKPSHNKTDN